MISAYQIDPANPATTAAILVALDRMIRYLTRTRQGALGGRRDASQEAIASVLGACRVYDLTQDQQVETSLMGDVTNALRPKVKRAAQALAAEVPLEEAGERTTQPPSFRQIDLQRAIAKKKINDQELQLLSWQHVERLSWEEIGERLRATPDAARMRAERIAQRLSQWADQKKKK